MTAVVSGPSAPSPGAATRPEFWRGKRVLVTGHTGFKGSWLTLWLHELKAQVFGYALAPETEPSMFDALGVNECCGHTLGDVRDAAAVRACMERASPDLVVHMAAQPLVRRSYREPVQTFDTNVMGTVNVLDAARETPSVRAVVVVTTDKCYQNREWAWPYRETDHLGGHDPYSASKAAGEIATAAYASSFFNGPDAPRVASARAGNVVGGGDWSEDRLVPDAARAFARGEEVVIRSPGAIRPWQHVLEPLAGYLTLARALLERREGIGRAYNFGPSPQDVRPVRDVIDAFVRVWNAGGGAGDTGRASWRHESQRDAPHEANVLQLDSSLAKRDLAWSPSIEFDEAVEMTAAWYQRFASGAGPNEMRELTMRQIARYSGAANPTATA